MTANSYITFKTYHNGVEVGVQSAIPEGETVGGVIDKLHGKSTQTPNPPDYDLSEDEADCLYACLEEAPRDFELEQDDDVIRGLVADELLYVRKETATDVHYRTTAQGRAALVAYRNECEEEDELR